MKKYVFSIIFVGLISCHFTESGRNVVGNYFIMSDDGSDDLSLNYHDSSDGNNYETVVQPKVYAIGFDKKYIIVKQHPRVFPNKPNKLITNYFIIPISKKSVDNNTYNNFLLPLSLEQFTLKKSELGIRDNLPFIIDEK